MQLVGISSSQANSRVSSMSSPAIDPWSVATRSPLFTPDISSACTCRGSAMGAPFCWARRSARRARRWELQLKGSARHRTRGWATVEQAALVDSRISVPRLYTIWYSDNARSRRRIRSTGDPRVGRNGGGGIAHVTELCPLRPSEYFYWTQQYDALRQLADYVIDRFIRRCRDAPTPTCFPRTGRRRTARLVAQWQGVGFCHGVLNTDNMSILGITIDYGPFGFMDAFDAGYICNHSDVQGRYAYNMQPQIAHWNLYALGQALIPLTEDMDATKAAIDSYLDEYSQAVDAVFPPSLAWRPSSPTTRH